MRADTPEKSGPLRYGYTTGACATAASLAAARLLLAGDAVDQVTIELPRGRIVSFELAYCCRQDAGAEAAIIKDAGDDPDVTHGALILAQVQLLATKDVHFRAGAGVGIVTRPGLPIAVGEPAINPMPRQIITTNLQTLATEFDYGGGFEVTIGVQGGAELAKRTMNPRLGIVGGLSILGTTGIVRPFSCAAYIASIRQAIDVARANGLRHLAACTGVASENAMRQRYGLADMALIEMGDSVGVVLKHISRAPVDKLSLAGGFGKISKLAAGHLDLHSRKSAIDLAFLGQQAGLLGADAKLQATIRAANTSQEALILAADLPLGDRICRLARAQAYKIVRAPCQIEVWAVDRQGNPVGFADA